MTIASLPDVRQAVRRVEERLGREVELRISMRALHMEVSLWYEYQGRLLSVSKTESWRSLMESGADLLPLVIADMGEALARKLS